jgi:negative regulator of sigma E activity
MAPVHNVYGSDVGGEGLPLLVGKKDGMKRRLKNRLWMGVAVVAVIAGVTAAAVMAAQPASKHQATAHHHKRGTLATAASYLGFSRGQLRKELYAGKSLAEIANATGGKSASGLIAALEATDKQKLAAAAASLQARITAKVNHPGGGSRAMRVARSYLGLSATQLHGKLRSGKTLAQLADATSGKSEAGLIGALVSAGKTQLAKEVQAGSITPAQEQAKLPKLAARVTVRVHRTEHKRSPHAKSAARKQHAGIGAQG